MRNNGAEKRAKSVTAVGSACRNGTALGGPAGATSPLAPGLDPAMLAQAVRGGLPGQLDALQQCRRPIKEARQYLELARQAGDGEAAGVLAQALDGLAAEARTAP